MSIYCTLGTIHNPGNYRCLEVISEITLWSINVANKSVHALISALTLIFPGLLITSQPLEKQIHSLLSNTYQCNSTDAIISSPKIKKSELDAGLITTTQVPGAWCQGSVYESLSTCKALVGKHWSTVRLIPLTLQQGDLCYSGNTPLKTLIRHVFFKDTFFAILITQAPTALSTRNGLRTKPVLYIPIQWGQISKSN